jgi:hypothetical protein
MQPMTIPPIRIRRNTGLRIPKRKATRIIAAHVQGMSIRAICRAFHTSHPAVVALLRNRAGMVEEARAKARAEWLTLAALATAELVERVPFMQNRALASAAGIAADKMELLGNHALPHDAPRHKPTAEEWEQLLDEIGTAEGNR